MTTTGGVSRLVRPGPALTQMRDHLSRTATEGGRMLLLTGSIASGKTHLENELLNHAATLGLPTLSATGAPDEQGVDAGVLDQLLDCDALPAELTERSARALERGDTESAVRDVGRALLRLAHERTVLVYVDDVQFVDESSLSLLLYLQRRIRPTRMLLVLNQSDHATTVRPELSYFSRQPHHRLHLSPLSVQDATELVAERLGVRRDTLAARLHGTSAGNPMLLGALIDDFRAAGTPREDEPVVGNNFVAAVHTILHRWDTSLRHVAGALAVLGDTAGGAAADDAVAIEAVATVARVDLAEAARSVQTLTDCGLISDGRYRNPFAAVRILNTLPAATRAELHARAAELRHQQANPAGDVAAHLVAAGTTAPEWSIPVLLEAAEQAARTDVTFAARCLDLAAAVNEDAARARTIARTRAELTWRVRPGNAAAYLDSLGSLAGSDLAALDRPDAALVARHALWHGDQDTFTAAHGALLAAGTDPRTEAELRLGAQWHFGTAPAAETGSADPDPWRHTANLVWRARPDEATRAGAETILQNCRLGDTSLEALATAITTLVYDNSADRAEGWCASLSEQAAQQGAVTWQALLDGIWSGLLLRRADLPGAVARAKSALGLLNAQNWGVSVSYPLTTLLTAYTVTGAVRDAVEITRYPVPEAMFGTIGGLRYLRARGHFHLSTNRVLAAVSDFQQCQRFLAERDLDLPGLLPWRSDLAEASLRLGNSRLAVELARQQVERSGEFDGYARGCALRVLAVANAGRERTGLLTQAAECFRVTGHRLDQARTMRMLGQSRPSTPPRPKPVPLPTRPTAESWRDPAGADSAAALSGAEIRVAELAAAGQTNREIATALFITVSTVEQHLTRVYRKLGVRGRANLPIRIDAVPTPA